MAVAVGSTLKMLVVETNVGVTGRGYWGMTLGYILFRSCKHHAW